MVSASYGGRGDGDVSSPLPSLVEQSEFSTSSDEDNDLTTLMLSTQEMAKTSEHMEYVALEQRIPLLIPPHE